MSRGLVQALLDTLRLGAASTDLAHRWEGVPLEGLDRLMAYEGAEVWLYRRWHATGAIDHLPEAATGALRQRAIGTAGLSLRIEESAADVLALLGGAGIPVTLIKGMARKALAGAYPYLDARGTRDIDLLIEEPRVREAQHLLRSAGYVEARPGLPVGHHMPALWNEARVAVELHWTISRTEPGSAVWRRFHDAGTTVEWRGHPVRIPPPTELAWHAARHAVTPADSVVAGHRLAHFLEVAALEAASAPIDWTELMRRAGDAAFLAPGSEDPVPADILVRWLTTARWLGGGVPAEDPALDLASLLSWRLLVLCHQERLGRALSVRFLEEGPRSLLGAPIEPVLPSVNWIGRTRRRIAGEGSRFIFRSWRAWRRS